MKKVKIDESLCIGCGVCQAHAEEIFEIDGVVSLLKEEITSDEELQKVEDAVTDCPTGVISIVEEEKEA